MSHNLRKMVNGEHAFVYNRNNGPGWHRLGIPFEGALEWQRALKLIEGDRQIVLEPLFDMQGNVSTTHRQTVFYDDTGHRHVIATVGAAYTILQNAAFCKVLEAVAGPAGYKWDTLGVLGKGGLLFATLEPCGFEIELQNGERLTLYIIGLNGHDGMTAAEIYTSAIRTVCQNTVYASRESAVGHWNGRHTPGIEQRIEEIQNVLRVNPRTIARFRAQCDKLIALKADATVTRAWLETLWPLDGVDHAPTRTKRLNVRELVTSLAEHGRGNDGKTLWSWYNGFTEWADGKQPARIGQLELTNSAQAKRMNNALSEEETEWRGKRLVSNLKGAERASREAARIGLLELAGVQVDALNAAAEEAAGVIG